MLIIPANVLRELRPDNLVLTTRVMSAVMIESFLEDHFGKVFDIVLYNRVRTAPLIYVVRFYGKQNPRHVSDFLTRNKQLEGVFIQ